MRRRVVVPLVATLLAALLASADPSQEVPEHLEPALGELGRVRVPVLVPPERPFGTTATVTEATRHFYRLLFTNDPEGSLSHAEQVNVFVTGSAEAAEPPPDALPLRVRGVEGAFFCGAAACFLDWAEAGASYSTGEFGSPEDAVTFAESLLPLEQAIVDPDDEPGAPPEAEDGAPPWLLALLVLAAVVVLTGGILAVRARRR